MRKYIYYEIKNGGKNLIGVRRKVKGKLKWGFMDCNGKEVIPCRYDYIYAFSEGLAQVSLDDERFFINEKGETVFSCKENYEYGHFEDGRCRISDWDGDTRGYVDTTGEVIVTPAPFDDSVEPFSEGLRVNDPDMGDSPCEYINEKGNVVIPARDLYFYNGSHFQERFAAASHTKYGRYGYLDQRGQVTIPFVFTNAFGFDGGMAPVSAEGKWGFIDRDGHLLIPFEYLCTSPYQLPQFDDNGVATVWKEKSFGPDDSFTEAMCNAIDRSGRLLFPVWYKDMARMEGHLAALDHSGGITWLDVSSLERDGYVYEIRYDDLPCRKVALLRGGKLLWGFSLEKDPLTIPCQYEEIILKSGVVRVKDKGLWGMKTPEGSALTPCIYDSAFAEFSCGLSAAQRDGLWGFIDTKGKEVIHCRYDSVTDFEDGRSLVQLDEQYGFIDTAGREVTPLEYDMAYPFSDGLAWVSKLNKKGSINLDGEEVIPCRYDFVGECSEGLVAIREGKHYMFLNKGGEVVIDLKDMNLDCVSLFKEGLCGVSKGHLWGFIDRRGTLVIPFKYRWPYFNRDIQFEGGVCLFRGEENWRAVGCFNRNGDVILPAEFSRIGIEDGKLVAYKDGIKHSFTIDGKEYE